MSALNRAYAAKAEALAVRLCAFLLLIAALLLFLTPTRASADVYKWADERGTTVISNIPPADSAKVTSFEVVLKETKRAEQKSDVTPTEQMLLDRIESLERQFVAQQYARPQAVPAPSYPQSYYVPPPPPPPPPAYSGTYYPPYDPGYHYPYGISYLPVYPSVSTIVVRSRIGIRHSGFVRARSFHHHRGSFHHHRGRR